MKKWLMLGLALSAGAMTRSAQADSCVAGVAAPAYVQAVVVPQYQVQTIVVPPVYVEAQAIDYAAPVVRRQSLKSSAKGAASIVIERRGLLGRRKVLIRP